MTISESNEVMSAERICSKTSLELILDLLQSISAVENSTAFSLIKITIDIYDVILFQNASNHDNDWNKALI